MEFFKQYLKIINYTLIGLVFAFTSFYLLANGYHYLELRKDYHVELSVAVARAPRHGDHL